MIKPLDEREKHNSSANQVTKINELVAEINSLRTLVESLKDKIDVKTL